MRELKFRAWDLNTKSWLTDTNKYAISLEGTLMENFYWYDDNCGDEYGFCEDRWTDSKENVVIQQFTGLLDSNNKEIYEGDFIKIYKNDCLTGFPREKVELVTYNKKLGAYIVEEYFAIYDRLTTKVEIIGNIFENPEFIK